MVPERGGAEMARKRGEPATPSPQNRRIRLQVIVMGALFLLGGLGLLVASVGYMWQLSEKGDRLRVDGVPVVATLSDSYVGSGRGSGADAVTVTYNYEGKQYQSRIRCGDGVGCEGQNTAETTVWVDPAKPSDFVAANGHTNGSLSFLNSWTRIVTGGIFAVGGAVLLVAILYGDRLIAWSDARKRRA
ncbi:DUF3592 domain-containing protein [Micromonospora sp. CPCC 205371]|nr:DUF3592 domain-containing protein [Micromonospora sp. CPCC 205371]